MRDQLRDLQFEFAAHIRDPDAQAAPAGIEDRRMKIYRDLFFNNINKFLANNFPVLRQLYQDQAWQQLVRDFYSEHRCQTPLFPELPKEFLRYLQEQRVGRPGDPPFMLELAHYEWVELALSLDENELPSIETKRQVDPMKTTLVLSPLAWPLSYHYPVHRIKPGFTPSEPPESATHLMAYRNREDEVKFMQLNDVTQLLLKLLKDKQPITGQELLTEMARFTNHPNPDRLLVNGERLLHDLLGKDILLCSRQAD